MLVESSGGLTLDRRETILELVERDGPACQFPGCKVPIEFEDRNHPHYVSIDHIYPQVRAKADGWTFEKVNDLSNLQLMGRNCNAKKGDALYKKDGTLDLVLVVRVPKMPRPEKCDMCFNGRILLEGEICEYCGSLPQPLSFPAWAQRTPKECDHKNFHCWMCVVGHIPREPASSTVFGVYSDE